MNVSSGYGPYTNISSDDRIATATLSGETITITGKAIGKATVTVTDMATDNTKTINVTVGSSQTAYLSCPDNHHPHMIDLGLPSGTKWACCNMDTDHPEKPMFFISVRTMASKMIILSQNPKNYSDKSVDSPFFYYLCQDRRSLLTRRHVDFLA